MRFFKRRTPKKAVRLNGKTAIVTGRPEGIAREVMTELYLKGARVLVGHSDPITTMRVCDEIIAEHKGAKGTGLFEALDVDLFNLATIIECVEELKADKRPIDILIHADFIIGAPFKYTVDELEYHLAYNFFGPARFSLQLIPLLAMASPPSRVITLTTSVYDRAWLEFADLHWDHRYYDWFQAYCSSRLANIYYSYELSRNMRLRGILNVNTYCVNPGVILKERDMLWDNRYGRWSQTLKRPANLFVKNSKEIALTLVYIATDDKVASESGCYYLGRRSKVPKAHGKDKIISELFWRRTLDEIKIPRGTEPIA